MHASGDESATPGSGESRRPNPEAIAWYVEEAQRLLEDQQRWVESLRTRGGQLAGFGAAALALIGGNAVLLVDRVDGGVRAAVDVAFIAAALCLSGAVALAIWSSLRPKAFAAISAAEIATYSSVRFLTEPDVWRAHVRSLQMLSEGAASSELAGKAVAKGIRRALMAFLAGLAFTLFAIATLLIKVI